jgi:branched-chain amino acid transport system permease protein
MLQFVQLSMNALAIGSIYAVVALSFEIAYEATGVVNFATGQLVTVGALIGASAVAYTRANMPVSYILTFAAMAAVGIAFYFSTFLPLRGKSVVTVVIGTVAMGIAIQNVSQIVWGPLPASVPPPLGGGILYLHGTAIPVHAIFVVVVAAILIGCVAFLLNRTLLGKQLRAVAQDLDAALLMGIRVRRIYAISWIIVAILAGIAGLLLAPMWFIDAGMGDSLALKAFAAAVIGGFGSIPGAICGGILVGLCEILGAAYVSSTYKDALVFIVMIGFLLLRPEGIFGERVGERG